MCFTHFNNVSKFQIVLTIFRGTINKKVNENNKIRTMSVNKSCMGNYVIEISLKCQG